MYDNFFQSHYSIISEDNFGFEERQKVKNQGRMKMWEKEGTRREKKRSCEYLNLRLGDL